VSGIQYHLARPGEVWVLTFTSDDLPGVEPLADAIAATFAPSPG
jgi:hypothetical protein